MGKNWSNLELEENNPARPEVKLYQGAPIRSVVWPESRVSWDMAKVRLKG